MTAKTIRALAYLLSNTDWTDGSKSRLVVERSVCAICDSLSSAIHDIVTDPELDEAIEAQARQDEEERDASDAQANGTYYPGIEVQG